MSDTCTISNCVCTFNITRQRPIDLAALARSMDAVEYSPKKFAAASLRLKWPKSTALVFSSGAVVVTGAATEYLGLVAGRRYAHMLRRANRTFGFHHFAIQNIVGSARLGHGVLELCELAQALGEAAQYNPDLFPGLILRMDPRQPCAVLLFRSGNCIVTGGRTSNEVRRVFADVQRQLQPWIARVAHPDDGNSAVYAADVVRRRVATGYRQSGTKMPTNALGTRSPN